jgi:hypothetical protein
MNPNNYLIFSFFILGIIVGCAIDNIAYGNSDDDDLIPDDCLTPKEKFVKK